MANDLTDSPLDRQNVLNNQFAITEIQNATQIRGVQFDGSSRLVKEQIAAFFEVDARTIERCLDQNADELCRNGYEVIRGKRLLEFKLALASQEVTDIDVGHKTVNLGLFDFRAFLNIGMLLTDSHRAKLLRQLVLDIVLDVINQKTGGGTKYINQRDEQFVHAWFRGESYRKKFTSALQNCVRMGNFKYAIYTDKVYQIIFEEKSKEYRQILRLNERDKTRDTFYAEVLDLVAAVENGLAEALINESKAAGRRLEPSEVDAIISTVEKLPYLSPLIESARNKMASRDLVFRDALHQRLSEYIAPVEAAEFERFLGEKSRELNDRLDEAKDVFKRLKERG